MCMTPSGSKTLQVFFFVKNYHSLLTEGSDIGCQPGVSAISISRFAFLLKTFNLVKYKVIFLIKEMNLMLTF